MSTAWRRLSQDCAPWILGAIALAVYLPGICWGVPHATAPNLVRGWNVDGMPGLWTLAEFHNLLVAAKPDWYLAYPLFHFIVLGAAYAPYLAFLFLSGGLGAPVADYPFGFADPVGALAALVLIGRGVTVAMACGVVVAAYLTATTVWDRSTGIVAAATVMTASPMFYYARMGNPDVPVLFWTALGLLVVARIITQGLTVPRGIWLGAFAALAVATKDQAYGAWVPAMGLLAVWHYRRCAPPMSPLDPRAWRPPVAMLFSGGLAFVVASGLVLSPQRFLRHMDFMLNFGERAYNAALLQLMKPITPASYGELTLDIAGAVIEAIGPIFVVVGLVGAVVTWRSDQFSKVLVAMALGHLFLVLMPARHMMLRYSIPLAFILAFFIARAIVLGLREGRTRPIAAGALVVGFAWLAVRGADLTYQLLYDARWEAGSWLASSAGPGDHVAYFGDQAQLPVLPNGVTPVLVPMNAAEAEFLREERPRFVLVIPDWSSGPGMVGSRALPGPVYASLGDGSLGYQKAIEFRTRPLWREVYGDLRPQVNPPVQIFSLAEPTSAKQNR